MQYTCRAGHLIFLHDYCGDPRCGRCEESANYRCKECNTNRPERGQLSDGAQLSQDAINSLQGNSGARMTSDPSKPIEWPPAQDPFEPQYMASCGKHRWLSTRAEFIEVSAMHWTQQKEWALQNCPTCNKCVIETQPIGTSQKVLQLEFALSLGDIDGCPPSECL